MKEKLINWLNLFLIADVFLVFLSFGWLAVAVIGHSLGVNLGLDVWYKLCEPLFIPAIGVLMAGAILSSAIAQIDKRLNPKS